MSFALENRLRATLAEHLKRVYGATPTLVVETPPRRELGDFALPVCFELARTLRRPPRQLAAEIAAALTVPPGIARIEPAGGGYLNAFADRPALLADLVAGAAELVLPRLEGNVVVEHTNINPNKAAHVGHLRNAVLGDTWVRLLRFRGERVEVQNYIDNTGVQVADVVAAWRHLPQAATYDFEAAIAGRGEPFDYICWDLYAAVSRHYEAEPASLAWRREVLHALEAGDNATADLALRIASAIVLAHLRTMDRLGIRYDVLPAESEILHLHFWQHAFTLLREQGAVRLESSGKNAGCWVMDHDREAAAAPAADAETEADSKVIVRSDGTVTYVGKDIAYQLWKFGLLPLDFGYRPFHTYPDGAVVWASAAQHDPAAPTFGHAAWVFNVIDVRQSYLQDIVAEGLRALGFETPAERSIHFSYEMVALTPACVAAMGYETGDQKRVDVSGRKGIGVKADDLIDRLEAAALAEVETRHPQRTEAERKTIARQVATGALRYFLLKFTRTTLLAFDFKEALSFEGETGPYVQYAAVRAGNILRKAGLDADAAVTLPANGSVAVALTDAEWWDLVWLAGRLAATVELCLEAREPAYLAKYAFQLAQAFNNFYHHVPVLQEPDPARRDLLLALVALVRRQLVGALALLGVETPAFM